MDACGARSDAGFTLIEVLVATGIFVFVAVAGFETFRQLGATASQLAQRAGAAAALQTTLAQLRSDAISATSVWRPASSCGPAISMMRRDAGGTGFVTYVVRAGSLLRTHATGPIDPCSASLGFDTVLTGIASMTVSAFAASQLTAHTDPVGGGADGAFFTAAVPAVAVSAHARDYDGSTIVSGNGIVEVSLDADPSEATIDLVAGNRPGAYTDVLTYACGARCAANAVFPEIAGSDVDACTADAPDLPDSPDSYAASATGLGAAGQIVTTAYAVRLRYGFTFSGASPSITAYREGPTYPWPAAANLADPYPVNYADNAVRSTGASALAALFGSPANLANQIGVCAGIADESLFHG